jgi:hypothetical protein
MQREAKNQIQVRHYERTGKRKAHRNGTRPRSLRIKTANQDTVNDADRLLYYIYKTTTGKSETADEGTSNTNSVKPKGEEASREPKLSSVTVNEGL